METIKNMPVGIQSFSSIIEGNYVYVDKTEYIVKLEQVGLAYFLSRPRRFGKSLFISMLESYFKGRRELFCGYYIERYKEEKGLEWKEYPVLKLDLNANKYTEEEDLISILHRHIEEWCTDYNIQLNSKDISNMFSEIIKEIYLRQNQKVVILIDEYDKPLLQTIDKEELNEQYRSILKGFYSVIKSCNDYIHISFLTGVTRFSKVSIFSDLNNLFDISSDREYWSICGITEAELENNFSDHIELLSFEQKKTYKEMLEILRKKYDGYRFSKSEERLYNPFSLLNVFKKMELGEYWFGSATPSFMVKMFEQRYFKMPDLEGNIEMSAREMDNYRIDYSNIAPLLFQAGYLTIKEYNAEENIYLLGFPNDEVRYAFIYYLMEAYISFVPNPQEDFSIKEFTKGMKEGDIDRVLTLTRALLSSIPYDSFGDGRIGLREQNYQTAIYLIFRLMGERVRTEVHSTKGRSDVEVETKEGIYIFEFKVGGTACKAIEQIKRKGYEVKYEGTRKRLFLIGVEINQDERTIEDWIIEQIK